MRRAHSRAQELGWLSRYEVARGLVHAKLHLWGRHTTTVPRWQLTVDCIEVAPAVIGTRQRCWHLTCCRYCTICDSRLCCSTSDVVAFRRSEHVTHAQFHRAGGMKRNSSVHPLLSQKPNAPVVETSVLSRRAFPAVLSSPSTAISRRALAHLASQRCRRTTRQGPTTTSTPRILGPVVHVLQQPIRCPIRGLHRSHLSHRALLLCDPPLSRPASP